jgi:GNAT superfamily N-acetyltransferase
MILRRAAVADAPAIARVHVAAWDAAFRGIVPDDWIDARTLERRTSQWSSRLAEPNRLVWIACEDGANGEALGFAGAVVLEPPDGEFQSYLQTLYVHPRVFRRGIGRQLLKAVCAELSALGVRNLALRTLRLGESRGFYERLGARLVPEGVARDAGDFDDVVYAFDDLAALAT